MYDIYIRGIGIRRFLRGRIFSRVLQNVKYIRIVIFDGWIINVLCPHSGISVLSHILAHSIMYLSETFAVSSLRFYVPSTLGLHPYRESVKVCERCYMRRLKGNEREREIQSLGYSILGSIIVNQTDFSFTWDRQRLGLRTSTGLVRQFNNPQNQCQANHPAFNTRLKYQVNWAHTKLTEGVQGNQSRIDFNPQVYTGLPWCSCLSNICPRGEVSRQFYVCHQSEGAIRAERDLWGY